MKLYHGSTVIVSKPLYGHGKPYNDYGQGFYCTEDPELAREWACIDLEGGFLNSYDFNDSDLKVLELMERKIIEWVALLFSNRVIRYSNPIEKKAADYIIAKYLPDISEYDVIVGYRADDSYFSYARAFLSNTISLQQLHSSMKLGNLGVQVCVKSAKGFENISFVGAEPVDGEVYFPKRMERDAGARREYYDLLEKNTGSDIFIRDIIGKEMGLNDFRI